MNNEKNSCYLFTMFFNISLFFTEIQKYSKQA